MDEITFTDYLVTCHTVGCGNAEYTLPVQAPSVDPHFICGVCSQDITDTILVTE